jgi:hypothetical protein
LLGAVLTVCGSNAWLANRNANAGRAETGQALMESQRLAKSTSTAMVGNAGLLQAELT